MYRTDVYGVKIGVVCGLRGLCDDSYNEIFLFLAQIIPYAIIVNHFLFERMNHLSYEMRL